MKPQEWAIPLAVGLVFGLGLWALTAGSDGDAPDNGHATTASASSTSQAPQPILLPFQDGRGHPGTHLTFLVLTPLGKAAALADLNDSAAQGATLAWQGDRVALHSQEVFACPQPPPGQAISCDPAWASGRWPLPRTSVGDEAPSLFRDGHNATQVTAYVFDEAGLLLASNAPTNETARFRLHGDFIRLPTTAWYLGANDTAPPGTAFLPGLAKPLVDKVRPDLDGLPVGGVASTRSNAYVSLYGSLFVTVRVDALVLAP